MVKSIAELSTQPLQQWRCLFNPFGVHPMSAISNAHDVFVHLDSSKAFDGQRLCILRWKKTEDNPSPHVARCISVPRLAVAVEPVSVQSALQEAFESLQDALIRKLVAAQLDDKTRKLDATMVVTDEQISYAAVAAFAAEEAISGRLTKESLKQFFANEVAAPLVAVLCKAMKMPETMTKEQEAKVQAALDQFEKLVVSLASPKAGMAPMIAEQIEKAVLLSSEENHLRELLLHKLAPFKEARKEVEMLANI
jgi:hypothetical protein